MRFYRILSVLAVLVLFASSAYSDDRVGIAEIKKMASVNFEPGNYRLDSDFKLGYGDSVAISLWGKLEGSYKLTIDRDGTVFIPIIGKVGIMGMSLDDARAVVKRELDKKYSNVEIDMNLADVRDIRVSVLGNAQNPGSYGVSPFSRVLDIIAKSGGPNDKGSISGIRLIRDDKEIASFNIYDFIFKGDQSKNLRLKHGDILYIPRVKDLVYVTGDVWYPGRYEIENASKLSTVIELVGGMLPVDIKRKISVMRVDPKDNVTRPVKEIIVEQSKIIKQDDDITVKNGDTIIVSNTYDCTLTPEDIYKTVSISGQVKYPGSYILKENETLGSLIKRAGGLKDTAFAEGAVFTRSPLIGKQRPILDELVSAQQRVILEEEGNLAESILTQQEKELRQKALEYKRKALSIMASRGSKGRIMIDLGEVMSGKSDLLLAAGDSLIIPDIPGWVMVAGAVYSPESIVFSEGKGLDYYLNAAGLTRFADKDEIYIIKPNGYVKSKSIGYGNISRGDIIVVPDKMY